MVLKDYQWVYDQYGMNVFIGYASYTLVFAFFESVVFLLFLWLLSYLFPKRWAGAKSLSILALWALVVSFWAVGKQVLYLVMESPPEFLLWIIQDLGLSLLVVLIIISIILPVILTIRFDGFEKWTVSLVERIAILSSIYLVFDLLGLIIVIFRNLTL